MYLLLCTGGRIYCGIAKDLDKRLAQHVRGAGARFTRAFPPQQLLAAFSCEDHGRALRLELAIKALGRADKLRLARGEIEPHGFEGLETAWLGADAKPARAGVYRLAGVEPEERPGGLQTRFAHWHPSLGWGHPAETIDAAHARRHASFVPSQTMRWRGLALRH